MERARTRHPASRQRRVLAPVPHVSNLILPWAGSRPDSQPGGRGNRRLAASQRRGRTRQRPLVRGCAAARESRGRKRTRAGPPALHGAFPRSHARKPRHPGPAPSPFAADVRTRDEVPRVLGNSAGPHSRGVVPAPRRSVDLVSNTLPGAPRPRESGQGRLSGVSASVKGPSTARCASAALPLQSATKVRGRRHGCDGNGLRTFSASRASMPANPRAIDDRVDGSDQQSGSSRTRWGLHTPFEPSVLMLNRVRTVFALVTAMMMTRTSVARPM